MTLASVLADALNGDELRTAAYVAIAAACTLAGLREHSARKDRRVLVFWWSVAAVMLLLGLGRLLDLGPWATERGRHIAEWQGWYDDRRPIQTQVAKAVIVAGAAGIGLGLMWFVRGASRQHPLALIALVYLCTFVVVRAISLHQIDRVLYTGRAAGIRPNGVLELAGAALVSVAVILAIIAPSHPPKAQDLGGGGE